MKVPFPLHPVTPVSVQVPEIWFPFTVPLRVRTLFVAAGNIVMIVISNVPVTLPLFPLKPKVPVSEVWPEEKQGLVVVKVKLVKVSAVPLLCVKVVAKVKADDPSVLFRLAFHEPLMLPVPGLLLPQPDIVRASANSAIVPICLYTWPPDRRESLWGSTQES